MPPRKSDQQRKSDVSTARFALMDEDDVHRQPTSLSHHHESPSQNNQPQPSTAEAPSEPANNQAHSTPEKKEDKKEKDHKDAVTVEDLNLPKSIITRLAKGVLPANTQIQVNAILAMSKSATVFINHLASAANEHTVAANKKTIMPDDVFKALDDVEYSFLKDALEAEFAKFNAIQTEKRTSYRQKVRAKTGASGDTSIIGGGDDDTEMADTSTATTAVAAAADTTITSEASSSAPRAKKARVDIDGSAAPEPEDAETEDEQPHDDDDDEDGEEEEEEEEEEGGGEESSGEETQDALEEQDGREERDEAVDGDESD